MALSHDVELPRGQVPEFPDRCVVCQRLRPRTTVEVSDRPFSWWHWLPLINWFMRWKPKDRVEAPACTPCGRVLARTHFLWSLCVTAILLVAIAAAVLWKPFGAGKGAAFGFVLVCLVPPVLLRLLFPPELSLESGESTITYEFRDLEYARAFAERNAAEVQE